MAFVIQDHVEGYHELSAKTKIFFATAVAIWDAEFYVKVDDDVHVNLGANYSAHFHILSFPRREFIDDLYDMQACWPLLLLDIDPNREPT